MPETEITGLCFLVFFLKLILEKERGRERERETDFLFHLFMHSLVDYCMCPGQASNLQPWCIRRTLSS